MRVYNFAMSANSRGVVRVVVVDEVRLMGNVTASVLKNESDVAVLGCATSFDEALSLAAHSDIVLLSSSLPNNDALRLTPALIKAYPVVKVIVTGLNDSEATILQYIEAGVSGYVLRDDSVEWRIPTRYCPCPSRSRSPRGRPTLAGRVVSKLVVPAPNHALQSACDCTHQWSTSPARSARLGAAPQPPGCLSRGGPSVVPRSSSV